MPDLLLELFSEEIPARMQARAERELLTLMQDGLTTAGIPIGKTETFSGPRRLALIAKGLPSHSAATVEERKGPRVGAPEKAIAGFLKSAGIDSIDQCAIVKDPKGDYYLARIEKPSRAAAEIVSETVIATVRAFSWPKSMRWGSGRLRWVRPLHSIVCLLDDKPLHFDIDGVQSGNVTQGHRFQCGQNASKDCTLTISSSESYTATLLHSRVVSARDQRVQIILEGAQKCADEAGLALVEDHGLLEENAGLVEWPVVLSGRFDEDFLAVPAEILMTAMRSHQKYFSLRDMHTGVLANRFILISNLDAEDGGKAIIAGNERVIRARLSDARFFWKQDVAVPLENLTPALAAVTFHEKLGTQSARVERIVLLARELASSTHADVALVERAAQLCKADLMTGTVGEFPELQGVIGRHIAVAQGEDTSVANAIADHYKPQGPSDSVPDPPVSIAVALADKLDLLAGFWAIDEKPTGSKDPFALRRAALGVVRIILENQVRLRLTDVLVSAHAACASAMTASLVRQGSKVIGGGQAVVAVEGKQLPVQTLEVLSFLADRLKVYLREKGARHDLIDAVYALPGQDDLYILVQRVDALGRFLEKDEGAALLALVRRALNILKIEEKKDGHAFDGKPSAKLLKNQEEKALSTAIKAVSKDVDAAVSSEHFEAAMGALARLREPVDTFFETVTVNADDHSIRENRLKLLASIRALTQKVADFSKVEG